MRERYFRREVNYRKVEEFWVREEDFVDGEEQPTVVESSCPTRPTSRALGASKSGIVLQPGQNDPADGTKVPPLNE